MTVYCRLYNDAGHKRTRTCPARPVGDGAKGLRIGIHNAQGEKLQKE